MWRGIAAAALGGHVGDISHARRAVRPRRGRLRDRRGLHRARHRLGDAPAAQRAQRRPAPARALGSSRAWRWPSSRWSAAGEPWTHARRRRLDRRAPTTARSPRTSSTPSRSPPRAPGCSPRSTAGRPGWPSSASPSAADDRRVGPAVASPLLGPAVWAPVADELGARGLAGHGPAAAGAGSTPRRRAARASSHGCRRRSPWCWCRTATPACTSRRWPPHARCRRWSSSTPGCPSAAPDHADGPAGVPRSSSAGWPTTTGCCRRGPGGGRTQDLTQLFPDEGTRAAVEAEQRRLPLSYFDAEVPSPAGWERLPAAYLAFGDTYADERAEAGGTGLAGRDAAGAAPAPARRPGAASRTRSLRAARRD